MCVVSRTAEAERSFTHTHKRRRAASIQKEGGRELVLEGNMTCFFCCVSENTCDEEEGVFLWYLLGSGGLGGGLVVVFFTRSD